MKTTTYLTEFPDFGDLPALIAARLAAGQLHDLSWHNDNCPSFCTPRGDSVIDRTGDGADVPILWVDYADPLQRELGPESFRFGVAFKGNFFPTNEESEALAKLDALERLPDPAALALEFAKVLRKWLTVDEMLAAVALNRTARYGKGICASHDFCDANMAMLEAWETLSAIEMDANNEAQAVVWSAAWDIAKASDFATS